MVQFAGMPRNRVPPRPFGTQRARPYTIAKLLRMSLSYPDRFWARHVRIRRTAWMMDKKGRKTLRAETTTYEPNTPPKRGHFCSYRPVDPNYEGSLSDCPAVMVACTCQRWCFKWEYAAWYRGVSELNYCNGDFPSVTNPQLRLGCCKHLIVLGTYILQKRI